MAVGVSLAKLIENQKCLVIISLSYLLTFLFAEQDVAENSLLCRSCGHEVADAGNFVQISSVLAKNVRNDTILGVPGVLIQLFENPHGRQFEVITSTTADVFKQEQVTSTRMCVGFMENSLPLPRRSFEAMDNHHHHRHSEGKDSETDGKDKETFVALLLDSLLHHDFADSLLVLPKVHQS